MKWGWYSIETGETDWYPTFASWLRAIPSMWREKRANSGRMRAHLRGEWDPKEPPHSGERERR